MARQDSDTFARANQANWGTATGSPLASAWTHTRGTSTYAIASNEGTVATHSGSYNIATLGSGTLADFDITVNYTPGATGDSGGPIARYADTSHWYYSDIGNLGQKAEIGKDIAGTFTTIASVAFTWTAGTTYTLRFKGVGASLQLKVWVASSAEPPAWTITTTDSALSAAGQYGLGCNPAGATALKFDTFVVGDGILQTQAQEISQIQAVQVTQAREPFEIRAALSAQSHASFRVRAILATKARALFRVRALQADQARSRFRVKSALATENRALFTIRTVLLTQSRETFKIQSLQAAMAHAVFKIKSLLKTQARSGFRIKTSLLSPARETFRNRSVLGGPSRAHFLTKASQATPARATFTIKQTLTALLASARAIFTIKAVPVPTTPTKARGRDGLVVARSHDGLVVARGRDGNAIGRGR